jgi:hypothetical protein
MKSNEIALALSQFGDVLHVARAGSAESTVRQLTTLFEIAPSSKVADLLSKLEKAVPTASEGSPYLSEASDIVTALAGFLNGRSKAPLVADLRLISGFLGRHERLQLPSLIAEASSALTKPVKPVKPAKAVVPLRQDLVARYSRRLEEALGDENGFASTFRELSSDTEVGKLEAAAIAKTFAGASGATKVAALKKIWARHHNLMTFRAKSQSRDGRSAA